MSFIQPEKCIKCFLNGTGLFSFLYSATYGILAPEPQSISQLYYNNKPPQLSMTYYNKCFFLINVNCICILTLGRGPFPWVL